VQGEHEISDADVQQWTDAAFLDEARGWIRSGLTAAGLRTTGPDGQIHIRPWSTVLQVPTDRGTVYFKANHDALRHEAAVVELLSRRRPDFVPPPIAVDTGRGWLLMTDAGQRLRELIESEQTLDRWLRVLPLYGGLQLDTLDDVHALIGVGVPDMRLAVLPPRFETLLDDLEADDAADGEIVSRVRARTADVRSMAQELASYGIPEALQHDDLNDGQVYFLVERPLLLDWGDACISHPFFSMSVALEGVISWGVEDVENSVDTAPFRDAYLAPFADRLGRRMSELKAACTIAMRLGWVCRAVNGHLAGDPESTMRRLQMFLDGRVSE
jgi:hypothetical protein